MMSLFLILIIIAVVATALFDIIYYLPRFKALQEAEDTALGINF
jgi:hypothetical protein